MNSILTFVTGIKTYLIVGVTCFATGLAIGGYVAYDYVSAKKDNEFLILKSNIVKELEQYTNTLIEKERNNASTTSKLNERVVSLNAEKTKILASVSRMQFSNLRVLNANCVSNTTENRASIAATGTDSESPSVCKLNPVAEQSLFNYIRQAEELNEYAKASKMYVDAITQQRERMLKEQQ